MERLKGKLKEDTASKITAAEKKEHMKRLKSDTPTESRSLEILIHEFDASSGDFDAFHSGMNGKEKLLFKGYINSMRGTVI